MRRMIWEIVDDTPPESETTPDVVPVEELEAVGVNTSKADDKGRLTRQKAAFNKEIKAVDHVFCLRGCRRRSCR
jgi:hypothetical protein